MVKILVVDDETDLEALIKQKFRRKIRENAYSFIFAHNGNHALQQLQDNPDVDIVLSDINMPEMDGLTLLSRLNDLNLLLKSVIVSAYGDMDNIRIAMNRGAFDFITKPINFQDLEVTIEKTIEHVDQLKQTMQAIKENNILKMYVDDTVLNFMGGVEYESSVHKNETIEATVAFIDVCGFTRISETESPDTVVNLLNSYFNIIVKEVIAQNGFVDKFIGDSVMAVFRDEYHLDRAIDACLASKNAIENLPEKSGLKGYTPKVSIGINAGEMVSGNIGSTDLKRLDFTVIGDTVNVAQRLQGKVKEGQILITEDAYSKVKESFKCEKVGSFSLKNKSKDLTVYEVIE